MSNVDEGLHEVEDDYLSFIWFSLAEMPSFGERILLLSRNRIDNGRRTSFSISLQGTVGGVRPLISLGNPTRAGEWIPFAEASLQVERWYALVISHVEAGFLTVRMISKGNDSPPVLLGAHRVVEGAEKEHKATLSVGSIGSQGFRGRIGSFGMVRGNSLEDHMQDYIEAISDPSEGPPKALLRTVMLWATPYNDQSSYHREVRIEEEMRSVKKTIKNRDRKSTEKRVKKRLNLVKKAYLRRNSIKKNYRKRRESRYSRLFPTKSRQINE